MRGVGREAVVEGCDAGELVDGGGVRFEEVREGWLNAAAVLSWVAPGAAMDVAGECQSAVFIVSALL